jgi:hypothetical protein
VAEAHIGIGIYGYGIITIDVGITITADTLLMWASTTTAYQNFVITCHEFFLIYI